AVPASNSTRRQSKLPRPFRLTRRTSGSSLFTIRAPANCRPLPASSSQPLSDEKFAAPNGDPVRISASKSALVFALTRVVLTWPIGPAHLIIGVPGRGAWLFRCARAGRAGCGRRFSHGASFGALTLLAGHGLLEPLHSGCGRLDPKPRQAHQLVHRLSDEIAGRFAPAGLAACLLAVVVHCRALIVGISTRLPRLTPRLGHGSRKRRLPAPRPWNPPSTKKVECSLPDDDQQ